MTTTTEYPASDKQIGFLTSLCAERPNWASVNNLFEDTISRLSKSAASSFISEALSTPKELRAVAPKAYTTSALPDVPEGYYAVPSATGNNDLDFFRVDRPTEGRWAGYTFVKRVIGGHPDYGVGKAQTKPILDRIVEFGVERAVMTYGVELGQCYVCNRTLTDDLSRSLGIGPTCRNKGA